MWSIFKKILPVSTQIKPTPAQKNHKPFNLDLSTRSGLKSLQKIKPADTSDHLTTYANTIANIAMPPTLWDEYQRGARTGASNKKLTKIVKADPLLCAVILKTVNSSAFGLSKPITNLNRAISYLGSNLVRSIVAKHCFSIILPQRNHVYNISTLWKHAIAVSALAEVISQYIPNCNKDNAATIGLFHDIGRVGLNFFNTEYMPAEFNPDEGYLVYETQRFGCTHVEVGEIFANHWQLPEHIQQGIKWHHHPGGADASAVPETIRAEVFAVYIADLLAKHLDFHGGNTSKTLPNESYSYLLPNMTLYDLMHENAVSKELWRINCIDF